MNPETQTTIDEFLGKKEDVCDGIMDDFKQTLGLVPPFILPILRERPDSFAFNGLGDLYTFNPESMDRKTAELAAVSAAAAIGADACLKVHIGAALSEGATREQIRDTISIAALIGKTGILGASFRVMNKAIPDEE
ncbi:carboxymuconolactone decarboxylase family protein [Methanogenium cariaci]|uniref:carboxymuconolactone decarboxylase family protein n=1 Tax=Methanogenium cariaci TaxID=2197 RepID=UPI000781CA96|nr:carboxymuconolactone decarboxylase family protein [Methanogenium cariaci]